MFTTVVTLTTHSSLCNSDSPGFCWTFLLGAVEQTFVLIIPPV